MKPYYEDTESGITIYHGDCRDILPQFPDKSFDLVLTDPPYGINYRSNYRQIRFDRIVGDEQIDSEWLKKTNISENGSLYVFCGEQTMDSAKTAMREGGFPVSRLIPWNKGAASGGDLSNYANQFEYILFSKKKYAILKGSRDSNAISVPRVHPTKLIHPAEKPIDLLIYLITKSTEFSDSVLDPFMGSGTTLVAAKQLGRKAVGIEIEEKYCEIAVKRLSQTQMQFAPAKKQEPEHPKLFG